MRPVLTALLLLLVPATAQAVCGDAQIIGDEECDDGNTAAGDGCSDGCDVEYAFDCEGPMDLSTADIEIWGSDATWTLDPAGLFAVANDNAAATAAVADFDASYGPITFELEVQTTYDDDYVGFAVGVLPGDSSSSSADFLLVDWKRLDQYAYSGWAYAGLALSRVTGVSSYSDLWAHTGTVTELARGATLGATGWASWTPYEVVIRTPSRARSAPTRWTRTRTTTACWTARSWPGAPTRWTRTRTTTACWTARSWPGAPTRWTRTRTTTG